MDRTMTAKCDFCSTIDPEWVYPAESFDVAELAWGSSGGWTACTECSDLIERRLNDQVVKRMLDKALPQALADVVAVVPGYRMTKAERKHTETQTWRIFNRFLQTRKGSRMLFG